MCPPCGLPVVIVRAPARNRSRRSRGRPPQRAYDRSRLRTLPRSDRSVCRVELGAGSTLGRVGARARAKHRLRRWFGHDPVRFEESSAVTRRSWPPSGKLRELRRRAREGTLALVFAARDTEHNDPVVLAEILRRGRPHPTGVLRSRSARRDFFSSVPDSARASCMPSTIRGGRDQERVLVGFSPGVVKEPGVDYSSFAPPAGSGSW